MLVSLRMNRYGHVEADPVNDRIGRKIRRHLRSMGAGGRDADSVVYLQTDPLTDLSGIIPARAIRDLDAGWAVKCRIDPWTFGNMVGYDTHEIL